MRSSSYGPHTRLATYAEDRNENRRVPLHAKSSFFGNTTRYLTPLPPAENPPVSIPHPPSLHRQNSSNTQKHVRRLLSPS